MDKTKHADFIFCIGYEGATALVDGKMKAQYGSYSTLQLAEAGLFRPACASALSSENPEEIKAFIEFYNKKTGSAITTPEELSKLFGVSIEDFSGKTVRILK